MEAATISAIAAAEVPLFARLPQRRRQALEERLRIECLEPGGRVFDEGQTNPCRLYVVLKGEAALCNRGKTFSTHMMAEYETGVRRKHDVIGAVSFLDGEPYSSSLLAKTPLTLAILDFSPPLSPASRKLKAAVVAALRQELTSELRHSIMHRLDSLQNEAEFARYKNAVGRIVVTTLAILSAYTLLLSLLPAFMVALTVNFALSPFIILMFAAVMGPVILYSGFPPSFFGLQTANWKSALGFSVLASLGFIFVGAGVKLILIHTTQTFAGLSLVGVADVREGMHQVISSPLYWIAVCLYLVLTPIQEFVARSCLQAPLYAFLNGTPFWRHLWSILVSNLVFAAAHSHISFAFAVAAFVPGLFWGWIFARTNSLLAASASHFMIGGGGIFLFGIEEVIAKLTQLGGMMM
jgi:membrane protease YdiL (CAAX protease family)